LKLISKNPQKSTVVSGELCLRSTSVRKTLTLQEDSNDADLLNVDDISLNDFIEKLQSAQTAEASKLS
jgi:hypothetical protein